MVLGGSVPRDHYEAALVERGLAGVRVSELETERESLREELRAAAVAFERISLMTGNAQAKSRIDGESLVHIRRFLGE